MQQMSVEMEEYIEEINNLEGQLNVNDDAKWLTKIKLLEQDIEALNLKLKDTKIDVRQLTEENEDMTKIIDQKSQQIYSLQ